MKRSNMQNFTKLIITEDNYTVINANIPDIQCEGFFLIDTGATHSIMLGVPTMFSGGRNDTNRNIIVNFEISIKNKVFKHDFYVLEKSIKIKEYNLLGILGTDFLSKFRCIINYRNNIFYWNQPKKRVKYEANFSYPIHIGYNKIGIPVAAIDNNEASICAIVDTGSNANIINKNAALENCLISTNLSGNESLIEILGKKINATKLGLTFNLISYSSGKISYTEYKAPFYIPTDKNDLFSSIDRRLPIQAILGNTFLHKYGWILDFSNDLMTSF